jgi:hypothetical protein
MAELIAIIILVCSLIGMGVIVFRKIPILLTLPEDLPQKESFISKLKERLKKLNPFRNFSYEIFLQKVLTKIRILSLKADNKTFNWLQKLREKYKKTKIEEKDNYWEEVKKEIKKPR